MAVPTHSETTSILALTVGRAFAYQPSAANLALSECEADASTDVLTFAETNNEWAANDPAILVPIAGGALPTGLSAGTTYYVRDLTGSPYASCKLAATSGGSAIDITADGTPFKLYKGNSWSVDNLPPGLSLNAATGLISGAPTTPGVYVCQLRCRNASGVSADRELVIGVGENAYEEDGGIDLEVDLTTGEVTPVGGIVEEITGAAAGLFAAEEAKPAVILRAKLGDQFFINIGFRKGGRLVSLPMALLTLGIKEFEGEALVELNDGTWSEVGSADTPKYQIRADFDQAALSTILGSYEGDVATYFAALAEIEFQTTYNDGGTLLTNTRTSRRFGIRVDRDLIQ